jgi:hypothetical protein
MSDVSDLLYCPRCLEVVEHCDVGKAKIDGEPAHVICTIEELDEGGLDDFHN